MTAKHKSDSPRPSLFGRRWVLAVAGIGLIAVAAVLVVLALQPDTDDGVAAYQRGDYAAVEQILRPLAESGDPDAQYLLGTMYSYGRGVEVSNGVARQWFERAAEQGHKYAQSYLGAHYLYGSGVRRDDAEAAKWFGLAAEQDVAHAQYHLGTLYYWGRGVPQDDATAAMWLQRAAEHGRMLAQVGIGQLYAEGRGVERDLVQAYKWFDVAASKGSDRSAELRDELAVLMTPEQVEEAKRQMREWMNEHPDL